MALQVQIIPYFVMYVNTFKGKNLRTGDICFSMADLFSGNVHTPAHGFAEGAGDSEAGVMPRMLSSLH